MSLMSPGTSSEVKFEIGHVLFIDIVGYSKLLINQQSEQMQTLAPPPRLLHCFRRKPKTPSTIQADARQSLG